MHVWLAENATLLQTIQAPYKYLASTNNMKFAVRSLPLIPYLVHFPSTQFTDMHQRRQHTENLVPYEGRGNIQSFPFR